MTRLPFAVAVVCLAAALAGCGKRPAPIKDTGPMPVTVAAPFKDKVTSFSELTGTIAAVQVVKLRPRVSGYITEVLFKDGDVVKKDQPLYKIDPVTYQASLNEAKAQVEVAAANLDLAQKDEARVKTEYDKGVTSKQSYDTYVAQTKVKAAQVDAAKANEVTAKQNLDWTTVTAPIDGKTDRTFLTPGNVATGGMTEGTVLTTINQITPDVYAYFDVDDATVQTYRAQNPNKSEKPHVPIQLGLRTEQGFPHKGIVDYVSNTVSSTTGSLQIRATVPNPDMVFLPGYYVRGRVTTDPFEALLVPDAAIVMDQADRGVYVVNAENKVEYRKVKLGTLYRGLRVILEGLKPDDRVVIRGIQKAQPGQVVEPIAGKIEPQQGQ